MMEAASNETWQPRIIAFVCRWCTYAGADLAGTSRLKYPPNIRIIKLPCSGRIDPLFLLRGFEMGADGVLVSGCHPGDCHYITGNYYARRRWMLFRELLDFVGFDMRRVHFSWVSAAEGAKFVDVVKKVTDAVREAGPFPGFAPAVGHRVDVRAETLPHARGVLPIPEPSAEAIRADLAAGTVTAVLGFTQGRRAGSSRPSWATRMEDVPGLRFATDAQPPLVGYLARRLREEPQGTFGIVAGTCEREAIRVLEGESQIDAARIRIYPAPREEESGGPAEAVEARVADPFEGVPTLDRAAEERWSFWTAQFARCIRCNACRGSCPLCACVRCVADKTRPRWIDAPSSPAANWVWSITRAFHHAGSCVECGGCTEACPEGIPIGALSAHLARVSERYFGSRPEEGAEARSPLVSYRLEDEAPFIL